MIFFFSFQIYIVFMFSQKDIVIRAGTTNWALSPFDMPSRINMKLVIFRINHVFFDRTVLPFHKKHPNFEIVKKIN